MWGSSGELSSCSFLMCFSLPESNSFPGPRQLHINWPRRQCQDYSVQVLWRCHRQLNIDLEVCSYSLSSHPLHTLPSLHVISHLTAALLCLFFQSVSALCMHDCLNLISPLQALLVLNSIALILSLFFFLPFISSTFLIFFYPLSPLFRVSVMCPSITPFSLFIRGFFKQPLAAGDHSLRQVLSGASAEVGLCRTWAGVAHRMSAIPFLSPLWGNKKA